MHKPDVELLLFIRLFPNAMPTDPPTLGIHVQQNLVPEVRRETGRFYGPIDCLEAQYPGLDYANPAHRLRLSAFTWHRKLFRAMDDLRLTEHEIRSICTWEGTRHAREQYETLHRMKIHDTTWDCIETGQASAQAPMAFSAEIRGGEGESYISDDDEEMSDEALSDEDEEDEEMVGGIGSSELGEDPESEDGHSHSVLSRSVGVELNQRLLAATEAATEARARGEDVVLDEAWEQWLKEAAERDEASPGFPPLMRTGSSQQVPPNSTQWGHTIPEVFSYAPGASVPTGVQFQRGQMPPPPPFHRQGRQGRSDTAIDRATASSMPTPGTAM